MDQISFDTLALSRNLRRRGFTAQQAEGLAEDLHAAMAPMIATKPDLDAAETRLSAKIESTVSGAVVKMVLAQGGWLVALGLIQRLWH